MAVDEAVDDKEERQCAADRMQHHELALAVRRSSKGCPAAIEALTKTGRAQEVERRLAALAEFNRFMAVSILGPFCYLKS